jgi:hypothetical protein
MIARQIQKEAEPSCSLADPKAGALDSPAPRPMYNLSRCMKGMGRPKKLERRNEYEKLMKE